MALPIGTRFGEGQSGSRTKGQTGSVHFLWSDGRPARRFGSSRRHRLSRHAPPRRRHQRDRVPRRHAVRRPDPARARVRRRLRPQQAPGGTARRRLRSAAPSSAGSPAASSPAGSGRRTPSISGLLLLAFATFGLALADSPGTVGIARFLQGLSSALTWAGALSWVTVSTPRALRGQLLGTVFGIAVLGAILGPMVGAIAKLVGFRAGFTGIGVIALLLAAAALLQPRPGRERIERGCRASGLRRPGVRGGPLAQRAARAVLRRARRARAARTRRRRLRRRRDRCRLPRRRPDRDGAEPAARAALRPARATAPDPLGALRVDRRRDPARVRREPGASIAVLAVAGALSFGGFYTPGIALVSDRAEIAALAQGLAFGVMNTAWAAGALVGPTLGGGLADLLGDAAPYLLCSSLCAAHARDDHRAACGRGRPRPDAACVSPAAAAPGTARAPRPRRADARR